MAKRKAEAVEPDVWPPEGYQPVVTRLPDAVAADEEAERAARFVDRVAFLRSEEGLTKADAETQAKAEREAGQL